MKTCTKCGESKPEDCYYKTKQFKSGLHCQCIACRRAQNRGRVRAHTYIRVPLPAEKTCGRCRVSKPISDFDAEGECGIFRVKRCRACDIDIRRENRALLSERNRTRLLAPPSSKTCRVCGLEKPYEDFPRRRFESDGSGKACRDCFRAKEREAYAKNIEIGRARLRGKRRKNPEGTKAQGRRTYLRHRETLIAAVTAYKRAHPEWNRAQAQKWARANPEKAKAIGRKRREKFPEKCRESVRRWVREHPEQVKALSARRRCRVEAAGKLSASTVRDLYLESGGRCAWCGTSVHSGRRGWHLDHIVPVSKGGTNARRNLAVTCPTCNPRKKDRSLSTFLAELRARPNPRKSSLSAPA